MSELFALSEGTLRFCELHRSACVCVDSLTCAYCRFEIKPGEPFSLIVIGDEVRFFCDDHERCLSQAGK